MQGKSSFVSYSISEKNRYPYLAILTLSMTVPSATAPLGNSYMRVEVSSAFDGRSRPPSAEIPLSIRKGISMVMLQVFNGRLLWLWLSVWVNLSHSSSIAASCSYETPGLLPFRDGSSVTSWLTAMINLRGQDELLPALVLNRQSKRAREPMACRPHV